MTTMKVVELMNDRLCEAYSGFLESVDNFCKQKAEQLGCERIAFDEVAVPLEHGGVEVSVSVADCTGRSVGFYDAEDEGLEYFADDFDSSDVVKILRSIDKTAVADKGK